MQMQRPLMCSCRCWRKRASSQMSRVTAGCRSNFRGCSTSRLRRCPQNKNPPGGGWVTLHLLDDLVGEPVGDGFLGVQVEVAVGILRHLVKRLARGGREDLVQFETE